MPSLPDHLKSVLSQMDYGALIHADEQGLMSVYIKLPHQDTGLHGHPPLFTHYLAQFTISMVVVPVWHFVVQESADHDQAFEMDICLNPSDPQARDLFQLAQQSFIPVFFVDEEDISNVSTSRTLPPAGLAEAIQEALANYNRVPKEKYSFNKAKMALERAGSIVKFRRTSWSGSISL